MSDKFEKVKREKSAADLERARYIKELRDQEAVDANEAFQQTILVCKDEAGLTTPEIAAIAGLS